MQILNQRKNGFLPNSGCYGANLLEANDSVSIDYGVYGAPETYLIDRDGIIRFKQIGPITPDVWQKTILPLVKDLNK